MIKNLSIQLNEAGKIKIGKKGAMITSAKGNDFRPPEKLDHFQITTTEKDENGDYIQDGELQNRIKDSGAGIVNADGHLIGLPIRLLYDDTELNFPTQYVSYVSGQRSCSGDGEVSRKRVDDYQVDHPCPCLRLEQGYDGKDKCKPMGTLTCVIDEAGLFGQAHKFRTTSMNSVKGILGGIELIKTATNGRVAGLPLMLALTQKATVTPGGPSTIYVVSVCYRGNLADLKTEALRIMMDEKKFLLAMDDIGQTETRQVDIANGSDDEKEFVEEFFPDAVVVEDKAEEKTEPEPEPEPESESEPPTESESNMENSTLKPIGAYSRVYTSFLHYIQDGDIDKAMSCANRLQKGNLFYYMGRFYPHVEINPKTLKPKLLKLLNQLLTAPQDKQVSEELIEEGPSVETTETEEHPGTEEEQPEPDNDSGQPDGKPDGTWDDSGPILKDQLRRLVQLKTELEKQGILRPDKWTNQVRFFTDVNKETISTAVKLTKNQGDTFIKMLESHVAEDIVA